MCTSQACTDVLQNFHRPTAKHASSPVKAASFGKGVKDENDPRPAKFKTRSFLAGYQDMVNMRTVNYCWRTGIIIFLKILFPCWPLSFETILLFIYTRISPLIPTENNDEKCCFESLISFTVGYPCITSSKIFGFDFVLCSIPFFLQICSRLFSVIFQVMM